MAPRFRWEFVVRFSGFGETAEEAWEQVQEGIVADGMGSVPEVVDFDDKKAYEKALLDGEAVTTRCELDDDPPEGCLTAWDDEPEGRKGRG